MLNQFNIFLISWIVQHGKQAQEPALTGGLVTFFGTHMTRQSELCVVVLHRSATERSVKTVVVMAEGDKRKLELEAIKDN